MVESKFKHRLLLFLSFSSLIFSFLNRIQYKSTYDAGERQEARGMQEREKLQNANSGYVNRCGTWNEEGYISTKLNCSSYI